MVERSPRVTFANKKLEDEYRELAKSPHAEDRKTYRTLQQIRRTLRKQYPGGRDISKEKIAAIYQRMFDVSNLWSLETPPHGTVLYTRVGREIRIVDIV